MSKTDLYRHFDKDGRLLYVGVSYGAISRLQQHAKNGAAWVDQIAKVTVEKFKSRELALAAEVKAITSEHPIHNVRSVPRPPKPKPAQDLVVSLTPNDHPRTNTRP